MPTLLALARASVPFEAMGRDLGPSLRGESGVQERRTLLEWRGAKAAGQVGFDLAGDPREQTPLASEGARHRVGAESVTIGTEQREKPKALGYLQ